MTAIDTQDGEKSHHDGARPEFLAHHFDNAQQQFEASKLGMWLFIATELLLFGGLFCAYAVYRGNHPEIFEYGSQFLDTRYGAVNTTVLILSSMTMAMAVSAAQNGQKIAVLNLLALTLLGGICFMSIKYVEYSHKFHENLVWGTRFYETPGWYVITPDADDSHDVQTAAVEPDLHRADPDAGQPLYEAICRSCHGAVGEGVAGQGKALAGTEFISSRSNEDVVAFLKVGRTATDPLNSTGVLMPARGGNPLLSDNDLLDITAFVRALPAVDGVTPDTQSAEAVVDTGFWIPHSSIPIAPDGPAGLADRHASDIIAHPTHEFPHQSIDADRPANAHVFFGIYFVMTGLHGLHVLAGMGVITWLIVRTAKGHFNAGYFTPIDLGGLYWHVVDLIWIFLFPLFYLID